MNQIWTQLFYRDGTLRYTGFIDHEGDPFGSGTQYYRDGTIYREGLWGRKGLLSGREYYPNGQIRFEGLYQYNQGYGPNYPVYGSFYDRSGELVYEGLFKVSKSGLGWPTVICPESYGKPVLDEDPEDPPEEPAKLYRDPAQIHSWEDYYSLAKEEFLKARPHFSLQEAENILEEELDYLKNDYDEYAQKPYLEDLKEEALFQNHVSTTVMYLYMMY